MTLGAAAACLARLRGPSRPARTASMDGVLRRRADEFGDTTPLEKVNAGLAAWFGGQRGGRAPSTLNVSLGALSSAARYLQQCPRCGWIAGDAEEGFRVPAVVAGLAGCMLLGAGRDWLGAVV